MWFRDAAQNAKKLFHSNAKAKYAKKTLRLESLETRDLMAVDLLGDVAPGAGSSMPTDFIQVGNQTFFTANDNSSGVELWVTDGTELGTQMVMDIAPGAPSSTPQHLTEFQGKLYFTANDQVHGRELWVSDGTVLGTQMVEDIDTIASSSPDYLTVVGNELLFTAYDATNGIELWKFDGNSASLVQDLRPGSFGSTPYYLTNVDGTLFFSANNADVVGRELWKYDSTNGIQLVRNIADLSFESGNPQNLFALNGLLYFSAVGPSDIYYGRELYVSDGSSNGTYMVADINPGVADSSPTYMADVNGELWFSATTASEGRELWKSDGTSPGTEIVSDYTPGSSGSDPISIVHQAAGTFVHYNVYNYIVYFPDTGPVEYRGNNIYPGSQFVAGDGVLYFSRANSGFNYELWQINTTTRAVTLVQEINAGAGSYPAGLTYLDGQLYFSANDGTNGVEPWLATFNPVVSISGLPGGNTGPEGTAINVSANITAAGAGGPYTYAWTVTKQGAGSPFASGSSSTFSFTPDDNGTYNLSLTLTDSSSQEAIASQAIVVTNADPVATIVGAPTTSVAGTPINLTSTVTDAGSLDTHTYSWVAMLGSTQVATGTSASFDFTPTQGGTYDVTFTATDDDLGADSDTVSIDVYEAPVIAPIENIVTEVGGKVRVEVTSTDNDSPPNAITYTLDPVSLQRGMQINARTGLILWMVPSTAMFGNYRVTVTATDNTAASSSQTFVIRVAPPAEVELIRGTLRITGTADADTITVEHVNNLILTTFGANQYRMAAINVLQIFAMGGAGNDSITVSASTQVSATLYGEAGDDTLTGGSGADMLFGGTDNDILYGGAGNDVLVGNAGNDQLFGDAGDDILIGGLGLDLLNDTSGRDLVIGSSTSNDTKADSLAAAILAWQEGRKALALIELGSMQLDNELDTYSGDLRGDRVSE